MKKLIHFCGTIVTMIISTFSTNLNAQVTNTSHLGAAGEYCGWNGATTLDFDLRHNGPYNMRFFTDSTQRMIIRPGTGTAGGYVGIGNNFNSPASRLHVSQGTNVTAWFQITGNNMNHTATDGFRIGVLNSTTGPWDVQFHQQENAPIVIFANDTGGTVQERMRFTTGRGGPLSLQNVTKTTISYGNGVAPFATRPVAILNLGQDPPVQVGGLPGGQRLWMDVGTFGCLETDNFYYGLKREGADHLDATINWGDNINTPEGADNLRFIFTAPLSLAGTGTAGTAEGIEVARITPLARMGIGNFTPFAIGGGTGIQPRRRLEIYDERYNTLTAAPQPQLRLTYRVDSTFTDFQSTLLGDLFIHPVDTINRDRRVGINIATPGNTLEINSIAANATAGSSGLRFTDLNSASTGVGNLTRALTVDANGDVVLGDIPGGGGPVNTCVGGLTATNYITKITATNEICRTQSIYEHPSSFNVGIGQTSPGAMLHVSSTFNTSSSVTGAMIDLTNTSTTPGIDHRGLVVTSTIGAAGLHSGVLSIVNGGDVCRGYLAYVNNSNTLTSLNIGYNASMVDHADATHSPTNIGFSANSYPSTVASTSSLNKGFLSHLGTGGATYYPGTSTGIEITNYNAQSSTGVLVNLYTTNASSSTATYYGVRATSAPVSTSANAVANNYAGHFTAVDGTTENIGVKATATGGSTVNYGVYATGGTICTNSPTPANCTDAAGYFSGAIGVTDQCYEASDIQLKENVQPLLNASVTLSQLNPVTFDFKTQDFPSMHLGSQNNFGFIAQEVQQVLPELVRHFAEPEVKDTLGNTVYGKVDFLALNYVSIIPILVQGFQEQQEIIDSLLQAFALLGSKTTGSATPNKGTIELENLQTLQLLQNDPNPFEESTMIRWNVPEQFNDAMLYFYDNSGTRINTYKISEKGQGELQVFGSKLSSGIYTYTLIVDGKVIDSKKMMKAK